MGSNPGNGVIKRGVCLIGLVSAFSNLLWPLFHLFSVNAEKQDICQSDYFRASCPDYDDVITLTHAQYGRMKINRCAKENFGFIGCSTDVLDIMDNNCSGKKECSVRILDENFLNAKPCHDDLKSYLEIDYQCIKVITPDRMLCQLHKPVVVTNQTGYLASATSAETGCGTSDAPWSIVGLPGQRINISLMDFTLDSVRRISSDFIPIPGQHLNQQHQQQQTKSCVVYATVREMEGKRSVTVCGGGEQRMKMVHLSLDNSVEIRIISSQPNTANFLLHFEVIGCPSLNAPIGGWMKRSGDNIAVFGCNDGLTTNSWQLVCRGRSWIGERKNCSTGLSAIIIAALALSIWFVILTVGLACLKKTRDYTDGLIGTDDICNSDVTSFARRRRSLTAGNDVGAGGDVVTVCPKHAIMCRLHGGKTTSGLHRIKDGEDDQISSGGDGYAFAAAVCSGGDRISYGSLEPVIGGARAVGCSQPDPRETTGTTARLQMLQSTYGSCRSPCCLYPSLRPPARYNNLHSFRDLDQPILTDDKRFLSKSDATTISELDLTCPNSNKQFGGQDSTPNTPKAKTTVSDLFSFRDDLAPNRYADTYATSKKLLSHLGVAPQYAGTVADSGDARQSRNYGTISGLIAGHPRDAVFHSNMIEMDALETPPGVQKTQQTDSRDDIHTAYSYRQPTNDEFNN